MLREKEMTMTTGSKTRESWLIDMTDLLRPKFKGLKNAVPKAVRVSCGFPSRKAFGETFRGGECWSSKASKGGVFEIFISPRLADPMEVSETLVHELVHACVGVHHGHKTPFRALAVPVGLVGKMTSTKAGDDLRKELKRYQRKLGKYPHDVLERAERTGPPKQGTRMMKVQCVNPECGCVLRTTKIWLDTVGLPTCGCGDDMSCDTSEDGK